MRGFIENARELGVRSPIFDSLGAIAQIRAQLFRMDLDDPGGFPLIENPLATPIIPDVVGDVTQAISNLNLGAQTVGAPIANQRNVSLGNVTTNVDQANQYAALWPGDSIGQLNKAKLQNQTKINQTTKGSLLG